MSQPTTIPSKTELLVRGIKRMAAEARDDVAKFYGFVVREEKTQQLLQPADHQVLLFDFVQHHQKSLLRMPVGTGKTYSMTAMSLWLLGSDDTERGAIVSKTEAQAKKPLSMVADYIAEPSLNARLIQVFPRLEKSPRAGDPWTTVQLTISRPAGIRDPSLVAAGVATSIPGSRLSWILTDDLIDDENSSSPTMREQVKSKFDGRIMSRLDPVGGRVVVTNTPWHREDLTYHLEAVGWPTLTMDIYGFVRISNADASWMRRALDTYLRPSTTRVDSRYDWYRLRSHDPDPDEITPLWPDRYPSEVIAEIRARSLPHEFSRSFLCEPLSEEAARCQREWVEKCKLRGMGTTLARNYSGPNPTYTGLDLGIGKSSQHDPTVFFTIERLPDGSKRILDVESGHYNGPDIVEKNADKQKRYKSIVQVEGNQAQKYIKDFAVAKDKHIPIRAVTTTGVNKHHLEFGVESIFNELKNGEWIIPCDADGRCHPEVQALIDDLLYYDPAKHTSDRLMAMWMAREASRRGKRGKSKPRSGLRRDMPHARGF